MDAAERKRRVLAGVPGRKVPEPLFELSWFARPGVVAVEPEAELPASALDDSALGWRPS